MGEGDADAERQRVGAPDEGAGGADERRGPDGTPEHDGAEAGLRAAERADCLQHGAP